MRPFVRGGRPGAGLFGPAPSAALALGGCPPGWALTAPRRRLLTALLVLSSVACGLLFPGRPIAAASATADATASPPAASDLDEASRLLRRMTTALRSLDYEGTLVYLLDNRLETLHLVHRVDGGQVQERLVSLSGPVRAVTRSGDGVTCTMPDGHPISVKSHGGRLLDAERIDLAAMGDRYRVEILGTARIAGRDTEVMSIVPRDALRYGYRLHLDRETGLPLKSDLIDGQGQPIEQVLFTSVTLDQPRPVDPVGQPPAAVAEPTAPVATPWRFDRRPAGFELTMHDAMQDRSGARVEHFLFSDGLSSYSVYIECDAADGLQGVTRVGAAHAAGRRLGNYQVTALGEVPAAAVVAAVAGVRLDSETAQ
jgi:sigma-E factor negative regulatory protein RseB